MNFSIKEKGQGPVEYALILVLVSIVVIAALMILGPLIEGLVKDPYSGILSDAPIVQYQKISPYQLGEVDESVMPNYRLDPGCSLVRVRSGASYKVGTTFPYPEQLSVVRVDDNYYQFCSNVPGTRISLYVGTVDTDQ